MSSAAQRRWTFNERSEQFHLIKLRFAVCINGDRIGVLGESYSFEKSRAWAEPYSANINSVLGKTLWKPTIFTSHLARRFTNDGGRSRRCECSIILSIHQWCSLAVVAKVTSPHLSSSLQRANGNTELFCSTLDNGQF